MSYKHTATARAVLRSLVPVICPPEAVPLTDAIVDHVELTFGATPLLVQKAIAAGFFAYEAGAVPRYLRRASKLTGERAEAYFRSWEHGLTPMQVQFARMLNQLVSLSCYEQPEMCDAIGYHPAAWIHEVTKKRLAVFDADIRAQQQRTFAADPLRPRAKKEVA